MKKKILIIFLIITTVLAYGTYWIFFSMSVSRLPKGELISEIPSPNETYTIKVYLTNGGATTSYAIRGELNFNNSGKKPRNIYWNYRIEKATTKWVDDETVIINGIKLKVPNEKYDWRRR